MLACPACGKKHVVGEGAIPDGGAGTRDACDRCGCDLSLLHAIRRAGNALLRLAKTSLEQGDCAGGFSFAARSWNLVHSVHSARVACLAAAAMGDAVALERWRRRSD